MAAPMRLIPGFLMAAPMRLIPGFPTGGFG